MTQPCKNFKLCKGYAFDREARWCAKCWKKILQIKNMKTPLEELSYDDRNLYFKFASPKGEGNTNKLNSDILQLT